MIRSRGKFFWWATALTVTMLVLQVQGLFVANMGMVDNTKVWLSLPGADFPPILLVQLSLFALLVLLGHLSLIAYAWAAAELLIKLRPRFAQLAWPLGLFVFVVSWLAVLLWNNVLVPRSVFAYWGNWLDGGIPAGLFIWVITLIALLPVVIMLGSAIYLIGHRKSAVVLMALLIFYGLNIVDIKPRRAMANNTKPHVILIGIDSFRNEYLGRPDVVPTIFAELADATVFDQVYTPLARTFPATLALLSGNNPVSLGARLNLTDPATINLDGLLQQQLASIGYQSVYALDERRFNNIDESYGFDLLVGPRLGAADFILGLAGDWPLINLLAISPVGGIFLPDIANNRAVARIYNPEKYAAHLVDKLETLEPAIPTFIMAHFCLPHWPFWWQDSPELEPLRDILARQAEKVGELDPEWVRQQSSKRRRHVYEQSLRTVDRQVQIVMQGLRTAGYLDNAIVVFYSDHSESLGERAELLIDAEASFAPAGATRTIGHGVNLVALEQNRTFLAFKKYGGDVLPAGIRSQRFFSYDLKPTLLDILGVPDQQSSGISMVPWIANPGHNDLQRSLILETGFDFQAINKLDIDVGEVFSEGASYYRLTEDGRLVIDQSKTEKLYQSKQRGILKDTNLLVAVPTSLKDESIQYDWVLASTDTKQAKFINGANLQSQCDGLCNELYLELKSFYGNEIPAE